MRKALVFLSAMIVCLFGISAYAQRTNSTTTTTQTTTTVTGPEHNIEGCVVKEGGDFFLIPQRGEPFQIQAASNQDLNSEEGHRVTISGKELTSANSNSSEQNSNAASSANENGAQNGTGNDLHRLANRRLVVDNVRSISDSCPVNWNPETPAHP